MQQFRLRKQVHFSDTLPVWFLTIKMKAIPIPNMVTNQSLHVIPANPVSEEHGTTMVPATVGSGDGACIFVTEVLANHRVQAD